MASISAKGCGSDMWVISECERAGGVFLKPEAVNGAMVQMELKEQRRTPQDYRALQGGGVRLKGEGAGGGCGGFKRNPYLD